MPLEGCHSFRRNAVDLLPHVTAPGAPARYYRGRGHGPNAGNEREECWGITRQEALKRIRAKYSPEQIGKMIDQGQHLETVAQGTPAQAAHTIPSPDEVHAGTETTRGKLSGLAGFMLAWREKTRFPRDNDVVFPSERLGGQKPLSASIMVEKYLRPAAVKAGVIATDWKGRFGFHNFRHSLASSLVKLKCDPKTVQGILRHEDVRTTMQLYAQSDQESRLEAEGKFLALLLGDKAHLLTETIH
jgi:hypothetical protein